MNPETKPPASSAAPSCSPPHVVGDGFYRLKKPGDFGPAEWLDLMLAVQDGRCSCMRAKEIIEREVALAVPSADRMAEAFCRWPLPQSVKPDLCVMDQDYPHRTGTNLLTVAEAKQAVEFMLANREAHPPTVGCGEGSNHETP